MNEDDTADYAVNVRETVTRTFLIRAKSEHEARELYEDGDVDKPMSSSEVIEDSGEILSVELWGR